MTKNLRFAMFGAGFWARYQLAAWHELQGVECVALCDRAVEKAQALADRYHIPTVYTDAEELVKNETLDFVDIVTPVEAHAENTFLTAAHGLPTICQKPIAPTLAIAAEMVARMQNAGVPFFIHENFRWQSPLHALKAVLTQGKIGAPFRAHITFNSGFPVFGNQPYLANMEQFIISDLGTHTLDLARFFFGEAKSVYCQTRRVHPNIKGEDAATIVLDIDNGSTVVVEMSFAENHYEREPFPQTMVFVEGVLGSAEVTNDYWVRVTTKEGTHSQRHAPPRYAWADPDYAVVHSSMVPCNAQFLAALRGETPAETTGADNLKTLALVFAAYDSAARNAVVIL